MWACWLQYLKLLRIHQGIQGEICQQYAGTHLILRQYAGLGAQESELETVQQCTCHTNCWSSKDFPLAWRQGCDDIHLLSSPLPSHSYSTSCQPSSNARHTQTHTGTAIPIHCRRHPICQGWQTHGLKCLLPSVPHVLRLPSMTLADITGPNGQQDTLTWCTERWIHKSKVGVSLLSFRRSFFLGGAGGSTWK